MDHMVCCLADHAVSEQTIWIHTEKGEGEEFTRIIPVGEN